MSLRVDLINQNEKRSGSRINVRTFSRIGKFVIPAIIIFILGTQILNYKMISSQLNMLESRWELDEPRQNSSKKLAEKLRYNIQTEKELEAWKNSRINWHKQIQAIIETTPGTIQITSVIISPDFNTEDPPSPPKRTFRLTIDGKNSGEGAMDYIEILKNSLEHHKSMTKIVESVQVTNYEADTSDDATELDRVFQIECMYKTLPEDTKK